MTNNENHTETPFEIFTEFAHEIRGSASDAARETMDRLVILGVDAVQAENMANRYTRIYG